MCCSAYLDRPEAPSRLAPKAPRGCTQTERGLVVQRAFDVIGELTEETIKVLAGVLDGLDLEEMLQNGPHRERFAFHRHFVVDVVRTQVGEVAALRPPRGALVPERHQGHFAFHRGAELVEAPFGLEDFVREDEDEAAARSDDGRQVVQLAQFTIF